MPSLYSFYYIQGKRVRWTNGREVGLDVADLLFGTNDKEIHIFTGNPSCVSPYTREPGASIVSVAIKPTSSPALTSAIRLCAGEPLESTQHDVQGIGGNFVPENLHLSPPNETGQVRNEETALFAHRVAFEASLIPAISCGAVLTVTAAATVRYARHSEKAGKAIFTFSAGWAGRDLRAGLFVRVFHAQDLPL